MKINVIYFKTKPTKNKNNWDILTEFDSAKIKFPSSKNDHRGLGRMAFEITTKAVSSNPADGEVYSIQHYVMKFVSDSRHIGGFLRVFRFPSPIKLTPRYNWNTVESGDKNDNSNPSSRGPFTVGKCKSESKWVTVVEVNCICLAYFRKSVY